MYITSNIQSSHIEGPGNEVVFLRLKPGGGGGGTS